MQNKPNFRKAKMNLNLYMTKDYENKSGLLTMAKQTQTNPIKPNLVRHSLGEGGFKIVTYAGRNFGRSRRKGYQDIGARLSAQAGAKFLAICVT